MMLPFGVTVIITPQTRDNFGERTAGSPVTVEGCAAWRGSSSKAFGGSKATAGQETVTFTATLVVPPGTAITATDRVTLDGIVYEVDGEPVTWQSPLTGTQSGIEVTLRKVIG